MKSKSEWRTMILAAIIRNLPIPWTCAIPNAIAIAIEQYRMSLQLAAGD